MSDEEKDARIDDYEPRYVEDEQQLDDIGVERTELDEDVEENKVRLLLTFHSMINVLMHRKSGPANSQDRYYVVYFIDINYGGQWGRWLPEQGYFRKQRFSNSVVCLCVQTNDTHFRILVL